MASNVIDDYWLEIISRNTDKYLSLYGDKIQAFIIWSS